MRVITIIYYFMRVQCYTSWVAAGSLVQGEGGVRDWKIKIKNH
jgi:hypothetical protein